MLPSQRALFDLPREVCYLNAASYSPLPLATMEAGARGGRAQGPAVADRSRVRRRAIRARPQGRGGADRRRAAGRRAHLVGRLRRRDRGQDPGRAGRLPAARACWCWRTIIPPPVLEWLTRASAEDFTVETVQRPPDGDWTAAVLAAIERPGAPPLALASISSVHWSDGGAVDLARVAPALRAQGAALAGRRHPQRRRDRARRARARSGLRGVPDLQVAARPLRPRLPLCREAPPGRRSARTDELRPARGARRAGGLLHRHRLCRRRAPLRHGRARSFHLDGDGLDRHGDDARSGARAAIVERLAHADRPARRRPARRGGRHSRRAGARAAHPEPRLPERHAAEGWSSGSPPSTSTSRRGSAGCASARTSTTTRPTSTGSSRCSGG